jgi:uncharacterized protein (TIGR03545 family)
MRKKFVYYILIPALVACLTVYLFIDSWVTLGLEYAGEKAVGAKVEIDGLHVSLFPLGLRWARLQVANPNDPWRNIAETGEVRFAMDAGQLLRGKYIIETMEVNELILGTKRSTDGSIPKVREAAAAADTGTTFTAKAQDALDKTVEKTPMTNLSLFASGINADSLVKALDIRTLGHLDSLRQQAVAASRQWDAARTDLEASKKRLAEIETGIKSINTAQLNSLPAITSAISTVDNALKGVKEVSATFESRKSSLQADVAALTASAGATERIVAEDFNRLKAMARIPNLNTSGIARLLVGDEMYARALSYLHWIDFAREHVRNYQASKPAYEKPARMRGQDIHFPVERAFPKFWVRKVLVSGGTDSAGTGEFIHARGEVKNITNDQGITRVPLTIALKGTEGGGRAFSLDGTIDRTKEVPYDEYSAKLDGVPLAAFAVGKGDFLSAKLTDARMNSSVLVKVPGSSFDARTGLILSRFRLVFAAEPKNTLERIIRDVLQSIDAFEVNLRLWTTGGKFDVAIATDLDDKIAARVQAVLGAELTKLQNALRSKLDATIAAKRAEVEKLVAGWKGEVEKQLGAYQSVIAEKTALVDGKKKELTDRLEKEKKGKVNEMLKGILKK